MPIGQATPPARPARPEKPDLLDPREVPRRRTGSPMGRIALLHALAHIELNAVDLHWDILARFGHIPMPLGFYDDWVKAADEESKHFGLICDCLESLGSHYGALPAHAGMWRAAEDTVEDLFGRLAVVPMVLEARGLDVTPGMIEIFRKAGITQAIDALEVIYAEEVGHVAYGSKWFNWLCGRDGLDPKEQFHALVRHYFHGALKPPFNEEKRAEAQLSAAQAAEFASAFGLDHTEQDLRYPATVVSTGLPYVLLPVTGAGLAKAKQQRALDLELLACGAAFVFLLDIDAREGRTWDPAGVIEDIATGSAAGPVAAYLVAHGLAPRGTPLQLNQGRFLQRPSRLQVCVGHDDRVRVGGHVQLLARAELLVDPATL